ncbi:hypothetical protein U1Q18_023536, partial [Sarracenia purpurea var. burkii]
EAPRARTGSGSLAMLFCQRLDRVSSGKATGYGSNLGMVPLLHKILAFRRKRGVWNLRG